ACSGGAGAHGAVPPGAEPRRETRWLRRTRGHDHARRAHRDCIHVEPRRRQAARHAVVPGEDRVGNRRQRRRVLCAQRASVGGAMNRRVIALASLILIAGCGYYNSLYNANRSFATAERATRSGDRITASREYRAAIERAAVSYRKYPDSRWADDALLLLGRARFALEEYDAAAAAMRTLLEQSTDDRLRSSAHSYLGASLILLHDTTVAVVHLDS